jgi:hypothetical protein
MAPVKSADRDKNWRRVVVFGSEIIMAMDFKQSASRNAASGSNFQDEPQAGASSHSTYHL